MKLLDTTVLIDILRGNKDTHKILNQKQLFLTTQINMFEVIRGLFLQRITSSRFHQVLEMFDNIRVLQLDDHAMIKSAQISSSLIEKGNMISDNDCLIAGIALSNGVTTILTKNVKDFKKIPELKLETY
ncbi:type II toxin-antitoxin system VapC family toxin [Nanoarchaeota archaeon]